jgi:predicted dehydrogenase
LPIPRASAKPDGVPIGAAIVGCGRISDLHVLGYRGRDDARVVAVCDARVRRARRKAREWGIPADKAYRDYRALLADPDVDLVELLVPHHLHAEMTIQACRAGKHVSVQKPMALDVAQAEAMIAAAEQAGVVLRVYENFVFYEPHARAKQMLEAGEIGEPHMIRIHLNTGTRDTAWKVPVSSQLWRLNEEKCGGGMLLFDHGYHLFSLAHYLMGEVERVYAWIDRTPDLPGVSIDAPATVMFQFKAPRCYGVMDVAHTPKMCIESDYYADDDRLEVIGERGILFVNRCTARTVDLPPLMMFRDGQTTEIPVERAEWHHSFVACTRHLLDALRDGRLPVLDGPTGKAVLQFTLAAHISAREGREVRPDDV